MNVIELTIEEEVVEVLEVAEQGPPGPPGPGAGGGALELVALTESEVAALPDGVYLLGAVNPDPAELNPPTGESVTIDEGAAISSLSVNLTLYATDDTAVTEMMISNDPGFGGASWEAYSPSKAWTLAAGGDGARTVYAKFRDAALNVSGVANDSTTYTAPANAAPTFTAQPTEDSKTATTIVLAYSTSDADADHYLLESSTDNGANWQTEVADETPGAGKTVTINTLSSDGVSPLVAETAYTCKLHITALTGDTTQVVSDAVVVTTSAAGQDWTDLAPNLALVIDAVDLTTMFTNSDGSGGNPASAGDPVGKAADQSGNTFDYTQTYATSRRPKLATGNKGLQFTPGDISYLRNANPLLSDDAFTEFVVMRAADPGVNYATLSGQHNGTADTGRAVTAGSGVTNTNRPRFFLNNGTSYTLEAPDVAFDGTDHVIITGHDGVDTARIAVDSGTFTEQVVGAWTPLNCHSMMGAQVGPTEVSPNNLYDGVMLARIVYKGHLTAQQITDVLAKIDTDILGV